MGAVTSAAAEVEQQALDHEALSAEVSKASKDAMQLMLGLRDTVEPMTVVVRDQCNTAISNSGERCPLTNSYHVVYIFIY
jgi:hypothetical protein